MKKRLCLFIIYLISLYLLMSCDTTEDSFRASNCYLESGNKIILHYFGYYDSVDFELYHYDPMTNKKTKHELGSILNKPLSSYLTISYKGDIPADSIIELYVYMGAGLKDIVSVERK